MSARAKTPPPRERGTSELAIGARDRPERQRAVETEIRNGG
jgi:hypothetical protein